LKRKIATVLAGIALLGGILTSAPAAAAQETIIAVRHGEKPPQGLGQLSCEGLNRALALPRVLVPRFGKPDAIFAPDPAVEVNDWSATEYSYVRPLITIEPTAIALGLPVNTEIGYTQVAKLQAAVTSPVYANARVYIAWEHEMLNQFARELLRAYGGNPSAVPDWPNTDYDRIYIFTLTRAPSRRKIEFRIEQENLNNSLSHTCPGSAQ
jgi:hypothetical protein